MDLVIVIAGIAGLVVAGYGLVTLALDARRRRQYGDIAVGVIAAAAVVLLLVAFGDRLLR